MNQCTLCDLPLADNEPRCPQCGLYQELGPDRPNPFRRKAIAQLVAIMVFVYLVVLTVVAIVPAASK